MLNLLHFIQGLLDLFYAAWAKRLKYKSTQSAADKPTTTPLSQLPVKSQRYWTGALGGLMGMVIFNLGLPLIGQDLFQLLSDGYWSSLLFCFLPVSLIMGGAVGRVVGDEIGRRSGNPLSQPNTALLVSEWVGGAVSSVFINTSMLFIAFI